MLGKSNMKKLKESKWTFLSVVAGGLGGYFYWSEIGCLTGTCPLQSHWQIMVPYGMFIGYILPDFIQKLSRFWT